MRLSAVLIASLLSLRAAARRRAAERCSRADLRGRVRGAARLAARAARRRRRRRRVRRARADRISRVLSGSGVPVSHRIPRAGGRAPARAPRRRDHGDPLSRAAVRARRDHGRPAGGLGGARGAHGARAPAARRAAGGGGFRDRRGRRDPHAPRRAPVRRHGGLAHARRRVRGRAAPPHAGTHAAPGGRSSWMRCARARATRSARCSAAPPR